MKRERSLLQAGVCISAALKENLEALAEGGWAANPLRWWLSAICGNHQHLSRHQPSFFYFFFCFGQSDPELKEVEDKEGGGQELL